MIGWNLPNHHHTIPYHIPSVHLRTHVATRARRCTSAITTPPIEKATPSDVYKQASHIIISYHTIQYQRMKGRIRTTDPDRDTLLLCMVPSRLSRATVGFMTIYTQHRSTGNTVLSKVTFISASSGPMCYQLLVPFLAIPTK
jgi:hypothetical protein